MSAIASPTTSDVFRALRCMMIHSKLLVILPPTACRLPPTVPLHARHAPLHLHSVLRLAAKRRRGPGGRLLNGYGAASLRRLAQARRLQLGRNCVDLVHDSLAGLRAEIHVHGESVGLASSRLRVDLDALPDLRPFSDAGQPGREHRYDGAVERIALTALQYVGPGVRPSGDRDADRADLGFGAGD